MRIAIGLLLAVIVFGASTADAHEIGTTRVSVRFDRGASYEIEVVTDAMSLVEKLSGQTPASDSAAALLQNQLAAYDQLFRRRVLIAFDGSPVIPAAIDYGVTGVATATSAPEAKIRLRGAIPANARQFAWMYSWTFATYALSIGDSTQWLEGGQMSAPMSLLARSSPAGRLTIALRYLTLGFTHIVPNGFDHMLFVLGIFFLSRKIRDVLAQVSAFTIAHSITLALTMYGIVSVSPKIVEPLIAVSIAYVAIENIFLTNLKPWRLALVFGFGLLHGMGFAGALKELGLPRSEFVTALVTFNMGVEAGQLTVIAAAFLLVGWYCSRRAWYRHVVVMPASFLIACTAIYWTVQRIVL